MQAEIMKKVVIDSSSCILNLNTMLYVEHLIIQYIYNIVLVMRISSSIALKDSMRIYNLYGKENMTMIYIALNIFFT
jgi:succinyl-CoA synthetase alpha subunit